VRREPLFSPSALLPPGDVRRRMGWLVIAHLLISLAPFLASALFTNAIWGYAIHVFIAFQSASLMLLAFWLGMGGGEFLLRLVSVGLAVLMFAAWHLFTDVIQGRSPLSGWYIVRYYAVVAGMWGAFAGLVAAGFLITRIWLIVVRPLAPDDRPRAHWIKFSMLHMLAAMSLCAVTFALIRVARSEIQGAAGGFAMMAALGLGYGAFFANTLAAAYAALGPKPLAPRIAASLVAAIALGLMLSFAAGHEEYGWQMVLTQLLVFVVATAVIIGSLLVVRSCGYRLIRRPKRTRSGSSDGSDPHPAEAFAHHDGRWS
jgi:hypothetical protein